MILFYFVYIFPFTRIRYIKTITINTHIDCANNSMCSVGDILLATKQGAFESVFGTFSVTCFRFALAIHDTIGHGMTYGDVTMNSFALSCE